MENKALVVIQNDTEDEENLKFTIGGYTIIQLIAYFIIYSIIGYVLETAFGLVTKGVLESRKSFLYGPFCGIYGLGAISMLIGLKRFKKNGYTLFIGGFLVGSVIEYVISLIGEMLFHIKWWDYSNIPFNINGRICILFSVFWGVLAIYLIKRVQPRIEKFLNKFSRKKVKAITILLFIFLIIDFAVTSFALKMFFTRLVNEQGLELQYVDEYMDEYTSWYENDTVHYIVDNFFSDKVMLKTFPNIKVTKKDGSILLVKDVLTDIQPYYVKVFTPKKLTDAK